MTALLDTGSQIDCIHPKHQHTLSKYVCQFVTPLSFLGVFDSASSATHYAANLPLRFHTDDSTINTITHSLVFLTSPYDVILGLPFFYRFQCQYHHDEHSLILDTSAASEMTQVNPDTSNKPPLKPIIRTPMVQPQVNHQPTTSVTPEPLTQLHELPDRLYLTPPKFHKHMITPQHQLYLCILKASDSKGNPFEDLPPPILQLIEQYKTIFPDQLPPGLPPPDRPKHSIELIPKHTIPPRKIYRQGHKELAEVKRQISEYLRQGQIRSSTSAFGAPILLVKKKDGSMRMCVDYRGLNQITLKNTYPLPRIDDLFDRLYDARFFTKLDLYSGYHQVAIAPEDTHKTAFTSRYGTYEFLVMPFGLTNAPATFQTAMNELFHEYLDEFVIVYLDDILVYSPTLEDHVIHLTKVFDKLLQNNWYCKPKKCTFASSSVEYLGHIIQSGSLYMDGTKMNAVREWHIPFKNIRETQSFLGLVGYYRRFIPRFSHIARPLHQLLHKDTPFVWTTEHTDSVNTLKQLITNPPCLRIFDPNCPSILTTDASDHAIGAVLSQKHNDCEHPCAFISRSLNQHELKYPMWEKELLAVHWSILYFKCYIFNNSVTLRTDNKPALQTIDKSILNKQTASTNRIIRWLINIQQVDLKLEHTPGKSNVVADALSRFSNLYQSVYPNSDSRTKPKPAINVIINWSSSDNLHCSIKHTYDIDPVANELYTQLENNPQHPRYFTMNGLIYTNETPPRIYIPDNADLRTTIFREYHDNPMIGHHGVNKTLSKVMSMFTGPRLRQSVIEYVKSCPQCQLHKPRHDLPYGTILPLDPPTSPWQHISLDLITALPLSHSYDAIFVIVDRFSKMAVFIPTTTETTAAHLADLVYRHIICKHGLPLSIVSDRDTRFTSAFWNHLWELCGTKLCMSTPNHPQTDGQTERTNRTLEQYLRIYAHNQQLAWIKHLHVAEFAYNNAVHESTGLTPFFIVYQRHPLLPADIQLPEARSLQEENAQHKFVSRNALLDFVYTNLCAARDKMIKYHSHKHRHHEFQVGDLVLVHRDAFRSPNMALNKFSTRYCGPFRITQVINRNAMKLHFPNSCRLHNVINVSFLTKFHVSDRFPRDCLNDILLEAPEFPDLSQTPYPQVYIDDIRDHEYRGPELYFLIKWWGYPNSQNTWEPIQHLTGALPLLHRYARRHNLTLPSPYDKR